MSNSIIRAELETRLKTWADAQVPKIPIAFEGVGFTKPTSGVYLEPFLLPSATMNNTVAGSRITRYGMFHVNCWALSGKGMREVETLAQSIVDLFPILPKSGTVSIERTPFVHDKETDLSGWVYVGVTIEYRHET